MHFITIYLIVLNKTKQTWKLNKNDLLNTYVCNKGTNYQISIILSLRYYLRYSFLKFWFTYTCDNSKLLWNMDSVLRKFIITNWRAKNKTVQAQ